MVSKLFLLVDPFCFFEIMADPTIIFKTRKFKKFVWKFQMQFYDASTRALTVVEIALRINFLLTDLIVLTKASNKDGA